VQPSWPSSRSSPKSNRKVGAHFRGRLAGWQLERLEVMGEQKLTPAVDRARFGTSGPEAGIGAVATASP
jgi:hypothetical protein